MRTRPAWLTFAAQTKARIDRLPGESQERRDQIVYLAYLIARDRHRYVGTLGDWEFVINETKGSRRRPT